MKFILQKPYILLFCIFSFLLNNTLKAQFRIQLRMNQWCVTGSHDCDGFTAGDSDFQYDLEGYDHSNGIIVAMKFQVIIRQDAEAQKDNVLI